MVKNLPARAGGTRDTGSIPGLRRSPGVVNGAPLQYSCLGSPMDRGAWRVTVHEAAESDTTEHLNTRRSYLQHTDSLVAVRVLSFSAACGILVPQPGIEPTSPALQGGLLTTGSPGKSRKGNF